MRTYGGPGKFGIDCRKNVGNTQNLGVRDTRGATYQLIPPSKKILFGLNIGNINLALLTSI